MSRTTVWALWAAAAQAAVLTLHLTLLQAPIYVTLLPLVIVGTAANFCINRFIIEAPPTSFRREATP